VVFTAFQGFPVILAPSPSFESYFFYADLDPSPLEHAYQGITSVFDYMSKQPAYLSFWQLMALLHFGKKFSSDVTGDGPDPSSLFAQPFASLGNTGQLWVFMEFISALCQHPDRCFPRALLLVLVFIKTVLSSIMSETKYLLAVLRASYVHHIKRCCM
jgi:hypothetical protein